MIDLNNISHRNKLFQYWIAISVVVIIVFCFIAYKLNIFKLSDYTKATILIEKGNKAYSDYYWGDSNVLYLQAAPFSPEYNKLEYNLANAYYQEGRYDEAEEIYKKLLKDKSEVLKPAIWNNLGSTYYMDGNIFQSFEAFKNSLLLNDKDDIVRQNFLFLNSKVQQFFRSKGPKKGDQKKDSKSSKDGTKTEDKNADEKDANEALDDQALGPYQISDKQMDNLLSISKQQERVPQGTKGSSFHGKKNIKDGPDY